MLLVPLQTNAYCNHTDFSDLSLRTRSMAAALPSSSKLSAFVDNLLAQRCVARVGDADVFECKIPTGPGVDSPKSGYKRVNFGGKKHMAHVLAYKAAHGSVPDGLDVSHLCGNAGCCAPSHLVAEDRASNIARRGCRGMIRTPEGTWYSTCPHEPKCTIAWDMSVFAPVCDPVCEHHH